MGDVEPTVREPEAVPDVIDQRCYEHPVCADKGDYVLPCQCANCGWKGTVIQTRGHRAGYARWECPYCGCRSVTSLPRWAGTPEPPGRAGSGGG